MTRLLNTFRHAEVCAALLTRRDLQPTHHRNGKLSRRLELKAARRLRRSMASVISEIDTSVMNDLMRILRKLSKAEGKQVTEYDKRLKLALELTNMTFSKSQPPTYKTLLWTFSNVYKEIAPMFPKASKL